MRSQWKTARSKRIVTALLAVAFFLPAGLQARAAPETVVPVGRAAGIRLTADGVMVVRLSGVQTSVGMVYPAKQAGLREGDMILTADGKKIESNEGLQKAVAGAGGKAVQMTLRRDGMQKNLAVTPVTDTSGAYRIGVMVRDSMAGIGTITYVDPATGAYGSLGHGICDTETGTLLPMSKGTVTEAEVTDVKRGQSGDPGELHGAFNMQKDMGTVEKNTTSGIFGILTDDAYYAKLKSVPVAQSSEIHTGAAQILSNVEGEQVQAYQVEITKLYGDDDELGRSMLLHVTDPALLQKTGGIVQGMSGSPVLQDGKLIGAVTHVLVNDPTRGYAIFIERMFDEMEK